MGGLEAQVTVAWDLWVVRGGQVTVNVVVWVTGAAYHCVLCFVVDLGVQVIVTSAPWLTWVPNSLWMGLLGWPGCASHCCLLSLGGLGVQATVAWPLWVTWGVKSLWIVFCG